MAPDDIPPPIGDPPETGGLLFTNLSAPRNKVKGETEGAYHARIHKDAKTFLGGRLPGETPQDYKHCTIMSVNARDIQWQRIYRSINECVARAIGEVVAVNETSGNTCRVSRVAEQVDMGAGVQYECSNVAHIRKALWHLKNFSVVRVHA
jgi:hypothetical protein